MRRHRNDDNYPATDESATKSASCRKIPQVCQFYSMIPICQAAKLKSLFTCIYYITPIRKKQYFSVCKAKFHSRNCIDYGIFFVQ